MTMEEIGLPPLARSFASRVRGLVLVTGAVGSGKSTTQAAMLDFINERFSSHIVTIEDPIEYEHENKTSLVSQRELGHDTQSFAEALRSALREDPDVVLVGEMRDLETVRLAITAAETGHLVISTLHTADAVETVNRIIDIFPTHQQDQVRMQLAVNLVGVIGQALVPRADGSGMVAAFEVLENVSAVQTAIRENKIFTIASVLQSGQKAGMILLDRSLAQLVHAGEITYEQGLLRAKNPDEYTQFALAKSPSTAEEEDPSSA
jgi:twitching motility protein PilT